MLTYLGARIVPHGVDSKSSACGKNSSLPEYFNLSTSRARKFPVAEAEARVIVDETYGLHERIDGHRTEELEAVRFWMIVSQLRPRCSTSVVSGTKRKFWE